MKTALLIHPRPDEAGGAVCYCGPSNPARQHVSRSQEIAP
jgi:hypothetical protein